MKLLQLRNFENALKLMLHIQKIDKCPSLTTAKLLITTETCNLTLLASLLIIRQIIDKDDAAITGDNFVPLLLNADPQFY